MITFTQLAPNVVQVSGLDMGLMGPAEWRVGLERMAAQLQAYVVVGYRLERTASGLKFRRNTLAWTLFKERRGLSTKRGHYLQRILKALQHKPIWSVSGVTPLGTAVITLDEQKLRYLVKHALYYARQKVPGGRIIQLDMLDIRRAGEFLFTLEAQRISRDMQKIRREAARISTGRSEAFTTLAPRTIEPRRATTLASTAWAAMRATAARLNMLGRR